MSTEQEVVLIAHMRGQTQVVRGAAEITGSLDEMAVASERAGAAMTRTGRRGVLMNQALFTMRRLMYGITLGGVAAGVAAVKMGFGFNSAMQQARVALQPVAHDVGGVQDRLNKLFNFTKYTPFQFKDVTVAFRQMFLGMRLVGVTADEVQTTLHSVTDALAATGRTSPGALNRVAVALQHMAYQGHLTGYSVNQLARDGIPIFAALRKELGLTGEQLHSVGTLGIPTKVALQAINHYIETTPGLMHAAYRQATGTLHGLFTTFKDNISQLMGNMETGVFSRFQHRLVQFNAFFGRISNQMRKHVSFATIVGDAFGGRAEFVWKQFAADVALLWKLFTGLVRSIFNSKVVWGLIIGLLVTLHGVLIPLNWLVQHFGTGIMSFVIPAMIGLITYVKIYNTLLAIQAWRTKVAAGEMESLTVAQVLYNNAIRAGVLLGTAWRVLLSSLSVLFFGRAIGDTYRALNLAERGALALRAAFIGLYWQTRLVTGALWDMLVPLLANPLTWVVLAVVAFGLLYWKVKAFRDVVNEVVGFLWRHPMLAAIVPIIGPLISAARLTYEIYKHLRDIYNLARHPLRSLEGGSSWWRRGLGFGLHLATGGLPIPGLQHGGVITRSGQAVVGESGPELLSLPAGAAVQPLQWAMTNKGPDAASSPPRQLVVQFVVGQRVLEQAIVDIVGGRLAQA